MDAITGMVAGKLGYWYGKLPRLTAVGSVGFVKYRVTFTVFTDGQLVTSFAVKYWLTEPLPVVSTPY